MIQDLLNTLIKNRLSPNQFYYLVCIKTNTLPLFINSGMEKRVLILDKWIDSNNKLTTKAENFLEFIDNQYLIKAKKQKKVVMGEDFLVNISKYREMFPKGNLPSGVSSRVHINELEKKFIWFFNTYKYDWGTVLKATEKYIEEAGRNNYMYMKNSSYFISKTESNKSIVSTLANLCEDILEGDDAPPIVSRIR